MNHEEWLQFIPSVADNVKWRSRYLVLRAGQEAEDIAAAEQALQRSLPAHLKQALLTNEGKSAWSLLETLAGLLIPGEDPLRLTPTGTPTAHLFPTLFHVLDAAKEWAVFFNVRTPEHSLLGGTRPAQEPLDAWATSWACYLPVGSEMLRAWEQQAGVQFSPQMQQLYLLMPGGLDAATWPVVWRPDWLIRGELYKAVYSLEEVQEQLQLPEELLHLLQDFVGLASTNGNSYGFFASEPRQGDEYHIYQWLSRELQFAPLAQDFGAFIELITTDQW